MGKFQDLTGQKFGRLIVIERRENDKFGHSYWLCQCNCGNKVVVNADALKRGMTQSCGCLQKERAKKAVTIHGLTRTKLYRTWCNIKNRCYNFKEINYKIYGGRGITMCNEWKDNFQAFYNWAMNNGYNDSLTIDRIDVNGNYEPNNCRWASVKEQANNRRNNRFIKYKGETHTVAEWSGILNINRYTLYGRLKKGWSIKKILSPLLRNKK